MAQHVVSILSENNFVCAILTAFPAAQGAAVALPSGQATGPAVPGPAAAVPLPALASSAAPGRADPMLALRGSGPTPGLGRGDGGAQQPVGMPGNPARVRPDSIMVPPLPPTSILLWHILQVVLLERCVMGSLIKTRSGFCAPSLRSLIW